MNLYEKLREHGEHGPYPLHMPGHKRNGQWLSMENPYLLDITEIEGFDDLHEPEGILREGMEEAARLYGADESWYLVDGSTAGILAGIAACTRPGDAVLAARNCHRSVYHGMILNSLVPTYLYPPVDPDWRITGSVRPEDVEAALEQPGASFALVLVTSPTYEGVLSDIPAIAEICHRHGVPLMVDEAHGAHLGFGEGFPAGALDGGADLVVQSLHKTLPAFTQTGLLHRQGNRVSGERVKHYLDMIQTSSPSYLLMAGLDRCLSLLRPEKRGWMADWRESLEEFYRRTAGLQTLRILTGSPLFFGRDPSKLVISVRGSGHTGPDLMELLRGGYGFELEMAAADYALAMTGAGDRREEIVRFAGSLSEIDARWGEEGGGGEPAPVPRPGPARVRLAPAEADRREGVRIPLDEAAVGKISLEFAFVYPPGIPILAPGEEITEEVLAVLKAQERAGLALRGLSEPGTIRTA